METQSYWTVPGRMPFAEKCATVAAMSREQLEATVIDERYNHFLRDVSDYSAGHKEANPHSGGKRVPYLGWYWRHIQFSSRVVPIGKGESFVGFMANNKWDYPERLLTPDEFDRVMAIIDAAMEASERGGGMADIIKARDGHLSELWVYMQTLEIV